MNSKELENYIFNPTIPFKKRALEVYNYQFKYNSIYHDFCKQLGKTPNYVIELTDIPFLPIELFKYHRILSKEKGVEKIFRSSGTTGQTASQHFVANLSIYEQSIKQGFQEHYGEISDYCILALLPSYLERNDASLVHMADYLMAESKHAENGFYLDNLEALATKLQQLLNRKQPTILLGVTFALLDFAEQFPMHLNEVIIMETGGMKGRRKEMTRTALHQQLTEAFNVDVIHSEYGMTELLSQAYFTKEGNFIPANTMQVLVREINDPFVYLDENKTGALNIIDLANLYSCSFIATQDLGKLVANNKFEILGRMDNSDLRGCNLMVVE